MATVSVPHVAVWYAVVEGELYPVLRRDVAPRKTNNWSHFSAELLQRVGRETELADQSGSVDELHHLTVCPQEFGDGDATL